jgi:hypothetical protein
MAVLFCSRMAAVRRWERSSGTTLWMAHGVTTACFRAAVPV